jgi:hypothetical protein
MAGQVHRATHRVHGHELAGIDDTVPGIDLLDLDVVVVRLELDVVDDAHRRHDEAELGRKLAPQRPDLIGQPVLPAGRIDQRQQAVADLDLELVELEQVVERLLLRRAVGGERRAQPAPRPLPRLPCSWRACRNDTRARRNRRRARGRAASECPAAARSAASPPPTCPAPWDSPRAACQRLVGRAAHARLRDQQARGGRDDQRRDLADQTVADRQQGVVVRPAAPKLSPAARRR